MLLTTVQWFSLGGKIIDAGVIRWYSINIKISTVVKKKKIYKTYLYIIILHKMLCVLTIRNYCKCKYYHRIVKKKDLCDLN